MIFTKIELQGFKSFAEKTVIELQKGITAVVGPNGSGKSNIADAIRWVLGEQSMKSLRGQKSQDIIFSGTQIRRSQGFAEVAIFIDNKSRKLNIEYDEVVVKRRLYRDGTSIYYINNNECRLKTIQELLMDTGIGKDGYSMIGQGRIDEILSNKSDERRNIFEEAAGIVKYRARKEESERKIEKTKLNLQRVNDILAEIELNIGNLEEQSEVAKKYLNLKDELRKLEILNFNINLQKYKKEEEEANKLKSEILETYNEEVGNIRKEEEEINELKQRVENIALEIEKIQNLDFETKEKISKLFSSIDLNKQKIENEDSNKERYIEEKDAAEIRLQDLKKEKEINEEKVANFDKDALSFKTELEEKEKELEILKSSLGDIELKRSKKKEEISNKVDEKYELENSRINVLMQIENIDEYIKQKNTEETNIVSELDSLRIEKQEKSSEHFGITKEKEDLEEKITNLKNELDLRFKEEEEFKEKFQSLKTEAVLKKSRLELLENLEKEKEGFNFAIKKLIEEAGKKTHYGKLVDSVLANILTLDSKYQVAIEMALGYSIQNIIVEKEEDAKELIEFLKRNQFGRASFLPISTIRGEKLELRNINKGQLQGIIGVASDLVKYNSKYKNIIDHLLGKIIVVDNNDTAINLARLNKYRFKIITLDGDIINPSGLMTGGSLNKTSGKILGRKNEIDSLESEVRKLEKELLNFDSQKQAITEKREKVSKEYEEYESKKNKLVSEYEIYFQKEAITEKEIEKLEKDLEDTRRLRDSKKEEKQEKLNEQKEIENRIEEVEKEIEEFEREISEEIQTNPEDEKRLDDLNFDITNLKISISSFEESKNSIREMLSMVLDQIDENEKIHKDREERLNSGLKLKEELEEENRKIQAEIEEIQSANTDFSEETESLRKERESKNIQIREKEVSVKDKTERLIDIKDQLTKYEFNIEKIEIQKDSLILYMWEEYEITPNSDILKEYENNEDKKEDEKEQKTDNRRIKTLKQEIRNIGSVNIDAIEEYRKTKERYDFLTNQKEDLESSINSLKQVISEMQKVMKEQFEENFEKININFDRIFKELFTGGKAEVVLENEKDSLESGIDIKVEPPGKKLQSMSLLSGGERALTAIALLFAILSINPSPFCVLDEIESALDEVNVARYARFLRAYSKNTQFLMITHRKGTMEIADNIYGVTMQESGISNIVSMSLKAAQKTGKN